MGFNFELLKSFSDFVGIDLEIIAENNIDISDVDVFLTGMNGDDRNDRIYTKVSEMFEHGTTAHYRNICGEYYTSSAFGLMAAAVCLNAGNVPSSMMLSGKAKNSIKKVLFYNHFKNKDHSLILLSKWAD